VTQARKNIGAPPPFPPLTGALDFLRLVWAVDHAWQRWSKHSETTTGVTATQHLVLKIVGRFPGIPSGRLAELLDVHPGTLSGIVNRLERQGLVRRRTDPRDGRRILLGLTDKGHAFANETEDAVEAGVRRMLDDMPPDKLRAAQEVLRSLAATLTTLADAEPKP
jgi:DNA-binding MarR family transcriptional regulator